MIKNSDEEIEFRATSTRKKYREDENSPINIFAFSQNIENLSIVKYPMKGNISGICIKTEMKRTIIALNSSMSLGRQNFTLAHELYHNFYDENMVTVCKNEFSVDNIIEANADKFASYLLMPNYELMFKAHELSGKHKDGYLTVADLIWLEQYFGVSHKALLNRLRYTQFIDENKFEELSNVPVVKMAMKLGYDGSLYRPSDEKKQYGTFGQYISRASQLAEKELISDGKYEELLLNAFRADLVYGTEEGGEIID